MDECFNRRLVFQWVRIVLRYSPIYYYMLMRQTSLKGFSRIRRENKPRPWIPTSAIIDDFLSLNNSRFGDYLHRIFPNELEKHVTDTQKSASYLDHHIEINNGGILKTKLYNKRDDFTFSLANFPFISGNIPASPEYGVYSYVILELMPSTVIFWTVLSCWQNFSSKATLLLG